ncbi:MAG: hypothetical protein QOC84_1892 [Bradyrhizobium sp.]|nr:hypothetical protein [Bradyrhizobium sp.]
MKMRLLATSAMSLALATAAFAQSPSTAPANSTTTPSAQTQSGSTTSTTSTPAQGTAVQNSTATGASTSQSATTPNSTNSSSQAQTAPSTTTSQQSTNPAPANQAQQKPTTPNSGATAQQPNAQTNTAQSSGTHVNAAVNINEQQRSRLSQSFARVDARPLTNVNFSISVGTAIPRDVRLSPLPADVVEIVPQYRGYNYVLVKEEIVIVDPATYKIVTVLPYSGHSTAAAPVREHSKVSFSDRDREVIRKHAKTRVEGRTTGSAVRTEIRIGERVPESVEIEELPDDVYRDSPGLREYRYIHRENRTYVVEPRERRVIEEID